MNGTIAPSTRVAGFFSNSLREFEVALALSNLSAYHLAWDRWDDARIHAREALLVARDARQYTGVAGMLSHLAVVAALAPETHPERVRDRSELAALMLGYVAGHRARIGAAPSLTEQHEHVRALTALRGKMESARLAELMADGSVMTLGEAIERAFTI